MATIQEGSVVTVEFTLSLLDGTPIETNKGKEPMVFEQGKHEILPGLERQLVGMAVGETRRITVTPEEGFGAVDPNAFFEVPLEGFPPEALVVGMPLKAEDKDGNVIFMRVNEVKESTVVLDLNHPLAGETLLFDVRIISIT